MHRNYPSLNGRYTPYGKLKSGMEVVEKIVVTGDPRFSANTPKGSTPTTPQNIMRAIVVRAGPSAGEAGGK
jgi:cyclophilin family peptidyl-prolyl cis-trans isomerase